MNVLYTARATASGDGRQGHTRTDDGVIDLVLAHPVAMGGSGQGSNPEQLFAAGYAACFHSAVRTVARERKLDVSGSTVSAEVGIGPLGERPGFGLTVSLTVALPHVEATARREVVDVAHQLCPYSNATRGNIDVQLIVAGDVQ